MSAGAARLPSALSAVALTVYVFTSVLPLFGRRTAFLAAIILCSSPLFSTVGHLALSDEPLAMFLSVALLGFASALSKAEKPTLFVSYASLSLAILCKGPIGLVLASGITIIYLGLTFQSWANTVERLKRLRPLSGTVILMIACLPYYIAAHQSTGGAFTAEFFLHQNLGRFEGTVNHQQPIWWYIPIVLGGFFPWTVVLSTSFTWLRSVWRSRFQDEPRYSFLNFCLVWILLVFCLFSAISTKLPTYIVPLSPALAIVTAAYLDEVLRQGKRKELIVSTAILFISASAALVIINRPGLADGLLSPFIVWLVTILLGVLILPLVLVLRKKLIAAICTLAVSAYLGCSLLVPACFLQFYEGHQVGVERLIKLAKQRKATLGTLFSTVPSAVFLYEARIETANSFEEVVAFSKKGPAPHYLLAMANCLKMPALRAAEHVVDKAGKWYLLSVDHCSTAADRQRQSLH